MFGFGKKKKQQEQPEEEQNALVPVEPKKKKGIDKLVMGAIIGVAVGSVVGMAVAPQKGKDTRKFISEKGKEVSQKIIEINQSKKQQKKFSGFLKKFFQKKASKKILEKSEQSLKKIPQEIEES